ncbi:uncharacterized protein LOC119310546 [Triticum dicoccoides]|uniref:F-box domain-containing protein n=1 Tax=Triticum turgidum subsp. durum TaxID=4567 RepID=A0A9R0XMF0_TRITD|nr:uncharacterized protein LOC119310546 [Triticum dicoccoides]VAI39552.1 unnamed protein product [Triticum turgidum subsp. durum]
MPPPPPVPSLLDELLEEIFLRLPPGEPEHLARASLASKLWLGRLTGPRFRGRYRERHGPPPMLGFLHTWLEGCGPEGKDPVPDFTLTTKFGARVPDDDDCGYHKYDAWDCRHGRVLLGDENMLPIAVVVWDPMTGRRKDLPEPDLVNDSYGAAVLCAVPGCDHGACHAGPFEVVFVGLGMREDDGAGCVAQACVSLPDTGDWSMPCPIFDHHHWGEPCSGLHLEADAFVDRMPPVLVKEAVHFMLVYARDGHVEILKYDLRCSCLSLVDVPLVGPGIYGAAILMAMQDGSLGFAHVDGLTLYIWSREMDFNRAGSWSERTIIDLRNLLPIQNPEERLRLIGSVEGSDTVFVTTDLGIYEMNVKSQRWKEIWKSEEFRALIPYMSFYNPQQRVMPCDAAH